MYLYLLIIKIQYFFLLLLLLEHTHTRIWYLPLIHPCLSGPLIMQNKGSISWLSSYLSIQYKQVIVAKILHFSVRMITTFSPFQSLADYMINLLHPQEKGKGVANRCVILFSFQGGEMII